MTISIIIPVFNEAAYIGNLISILKHHTGEKVIEIIVVDAGSTDNTLSIDSAAGVTVLLSLQKGRAAQMNYGASVAKGDILYFVHADTIPPATFVDDILKSIEEGFNLGRYRTKFMSKNPMLRFNEWFTRFDLFMCMGGDQTLFITKQLFNETGGFKNEMSLMEEYEFCERARKNGRYKIMKDDVLISARKYEKNGWLRVQLANAKAVSMYNKGKPQEEIVAQYKKMLKF